MTSNNTKVVGIASGVLLLVTMSVLIIFIYMINSTDVALTEQKIQRERNQSHQNELASLKRLVDETVEERNELASYVLASDDQENGDSDHEVISFLALIDALGREQGVALETSGLEFIEKNPVFDEFKLNVQVNGTYNSVMHILSLFETLPYQSFVSSVSLAEDESGETGPWRMTFAVHVTKFK